MSISNYKEKQNDYPVMKKIVSFLTAGLVDYSDVDDGKYLLRKEAIEKMLPTLEGRPLVIGHQKIDPDKLDEVAVGYVTKGYWNPETGSFDCDVLVKDAEILNPSKNAVSCAYVATEFGEGGRYSGIEYDAEILNGEFTHIALVDNPRYNDAKILVNGLKKGANMMIKRFFSNADQEEKKSEDEKKENEEEVKELSPDDVVTVGNEEVTIKELVDTYVNACKNEDKKENKRNEDKDDEKDNEDDEDKKDNEDKDEKKNEDSDDELVEKVTKIVEKILASKKNEDDEKKDNEDEKKDEDKEEKQNSLSLANMLRDFSSQSKGFETRAERIAESNKKYGL